jgi:hypothetical protein
MKALTAIYIACATLAPPNARAQGTFMYDQQSSTDEGWFAYGYGPTIQNLLPYTGQSFVPTLPGINFIKLNFDDQNPNDGLGATLHLNLRSDSISGPILGTTASVTMTNGFTGVIAFFFPNTLSVTPGTTYYFDLGLESGGPWNTIFEPHTYSGGEAFVQGQPYPGGDYWFREGLYVVPEPSGAAFALVALAVLALRSKYQGTSR